MSRAAGVMTVIGALLLGAGCGGPTASVERAPKERVRKDQPFATATLAPSLGQSEPSRIHPADRAIPIPTPEPDHGAHKRGRILRRVQARSRPGGRVLTTIGKRTEFGSPRIVHVVEVRDGWLGLTLAELENGQVGWIPADAVDLDRHDWRILVDRSDRTLWLRHRGRTVRRMTIAVGRPSNPTPTGTFAVTDRLLTRRADSPYGCCALALSGHQPALVPGWPGGDRLAIHGTPDEASVGQPVSLGCMRAKTNDIRFLMGEVPLGTPVTIRA